MKKDLIILFVVLFSIVFSAYAGISWLRAEISKNEYKAYYEGMRNELEVYYRTRGHGVNPAFICKRRTTNNGK